MQSRSFAVSFSAARFVAPLSAEKPISLVARFARGPSAAAIAARRSGVGSRWRVSAPSRRSFSLLGPPAIRKSETAAAAMKRSAGVAAAPAGGGRSARSSADCKSATVATRTISTPSGSGMAMRAAISTTSAPRSRAASARATPCRPDERFARMRTASIGSSVPPAVMTTRRPERSPEGTSGGRRASFGSRIGVLPIAATSASTSVAGSGSRPTPLLPDASAPLSGVTTV